MTGRRIVFTGKQQVNLESFDPPTEIAPDQVRVQTEYTLMSTGTENILFNRLFEAGSHFDNWLRYPFYPGYCAIGIVQEVGAEVKGLSVGQRVGLRMGHASEHIVKETGAYPVPDGISLMDAVWFSLAKIAFMGARVSQYQLGDTALIIGAGPIGQMSVRWAAVAGLSRVLVVDPVEGRLALARQGGATDVIAKPISECREDVLKALDGQLPRIVNDATGNAAVFAEALQLAARFGRVVILGDTGTPSGQHLTPDVITRGLTIVGAHDGHNDAQWNNATVARFFFQLVARGQFPLDGLNTHVFRPEDAALAYETANTRRGETMGILFDWTESNA